MSTTNGDQMIYEKQQKPHGHQNKSSNNKGKLNKHKKNKSNLKWKVKRSAVYITRLCEESNRDINDPWWKNQLGRMLTNCTYVIRTNGTFSEKQLFFKYKTTEKSISKIWRLFDDDDLLLDIKIAVQWSPNFILLKHHNLIFNKNPFFIRDYLSSVKTCRYKPNDSRWISIHWIKNGPACTVILSEIKAFNIESTIEFFKRKTIELSNITSEEFDGIV
eukprot:270659_1